MKAPWDMDFTLANLLFAFKLPKEITIVNIQSNCTWCAYHGSFKNIPKGFMDGQVLEFHISINTLNVRLDK